MKMTRDEEMDELMRTPMPQMYFKDYIKFAEAYRSLTNEQAAALRILAKIALKHLTTALSLLSPVVKRNAEEAITSILSNYVDELKEDEWLDVLHALMSKQVALEEDKE